MAPSHKVADRVQDCFQACMNTRFLPRWIGDVTIHIFVSAYLQDGMIVNLIVIGRTRHEAVTNYIYARQSLGSV